DAIRKHSRSLSSALREPAAASDDKRVFKDDLELVEFRRHAERLQNGAHRAQEIVRLRFRARVKHDVDLRFIRVNGEPLGPLWIQRLTGIRERQFAVAATDALPAAVRFERIEERANGRLRERCGGLGFVLDSHVALLREVAA
ncbi:MAG TPA: hypothetical protein VHB97_09280, partial [Polyangia bacterium]|nr:hypothetical protein [Polyangia bacterium]